VFVLNDDTVLISSVQGKIIRTSNGGNNWQIIRTPVASTLNSIFFINSVTGWAVGDTGRILKTTNSGVMWEQMNSPVNTMLQSVFFIDDQTGWISSLIPGCSNVGVLRTTNGGFNWQYIQVTSYGCIFGIMFTDQNTGWLASNWGVLKTTNGGYNWTQSFVTGQGIGKVFFINNNTGWASGGTPNALIRTTNGGVNWIVINSNQYLRDFYFYSLDSGWGCNSGSSYNSVLKTTNGGINWVVSYSSPDMYIDFRDVSFLNGNRGYVVGNRGVVLKTSNSGLNWVNFSKGFKDNLTDVYFLNTSTGFILANGFSTNYIYKTTNEGQNWISKLSTTNDFQSIDFVSTNVGWIVSGEGVYGKIYKTTDGGENWSNIQTEYSEFYDCDFLNNATGFVCGNTGNLWRPYIIKTVDGGTGWAISYSGTSINQTINCIKAVDSSLVIASGESGYVYRSTDAGSSWETINIGNQYDISGIFSSSFLGNKIWLVGGNSAFLSTNSGINWTLYYSGFFSGLKAIFFNTQLTGWIAGAGGIILYTVNGGGNWILYDSPTNSELHNIFFVSENTGWIVGRYGTVVRTTDGGGPIGISQSQEEMPFSFSLSQNYPNPFNPVTRIKYQISSTSLSFGEGPRVRLIIYDILGREIETLVNESQKPGSYEVEWDGSRYASGVYFYRLFIDDASAPLSITKKMVLIK
jgi:photosystem II stability/assembly factor-like uncharacterized protein